jgi:hypothetical protein
LEAHMIRNPPQGLFSVKPPVTADGHSFLPILRDAGPTYS